MRTMLRMLAAAVAIVPLGASSEAGAGTRRWQGAETFSPVSIGPDVARCGAFPRNVHARFAGSGIDSFGGPFTVTASGCLDTEANVLSRLDATDTYLRTGDAVRIRPGDAVLDFDAETCTATTARSRPFTVAGGTGALAGARGAGVYDLAFTLPTCPGPQQAVHVWFHGTIEAGHS